MPLSRRLTCAALLTCAASAPGRRLTATGVSRRQRHRAGVRDGDRWGRPARRHARPRRLRGATRASRSRSPPSTTPRNPSVSSVMLDVSGSMEGNLSLLRAASADAVLRAPGTRGDVVRVGSFGFDVVLSPAVHPDSRRGPCAANCRAGSRPEAPTPLWRAVDCCHDRVRPSAKARAGEAMSVLVLSDGKDSGPIGFRRATHQPGRSDRSRPRREDVMVYAIGMRSRMRAADAPRHRARRSAGRADGRPPWRIRGSRSSPEQTGGGHLELRPNQDLGAAFAGCVDELHSQYLLGFTPPRRDGKVHDIGRPREPSAGSRRAPQRPTSRRATGNCGRAAPIADVIARLDGERPRARR